MSTAASSLGMQGLWPGRRWQGREGVKQAIRQCEAIQIDPLTVIHRSHDLTLWGRVLDYTPDLLNAVMYEDRAFFDWGDTVMIYPVEDLPYLRGGLMRNLMQNLPRVRKFVTENDVLMNEVRAALRERWPLGNRDFESGDNTLNTFRGGKLTTTLLNGLWLGGEIMTHSRRNFDRLYAFTEDVAPKEYQWVASPEESEAFLARKVTRLLGMTTEKMLRWWMGWLERQLSPTKAKNQLKAMLDAGEATEVRVEHIKEPCYLMTSALPLLEELIAGRIPETWQPIGPSTLDEVTFLAPLEIVTARGRAETVFGFEYIWEVYKPAEKRRWGYYVLPILYGDQLVARMDTKLDRKTMTLSILGFWLEPHQSADDPDFTVALGRGVARLAQFHEASSLDLSGIADAGLRGSVAEIAQPVGVPKLDSAPRLPV